MIHPSDDKVHTFRRPIFSLKFQAKNAGKCSSEAHKIYTFSRAAWGEGGGSTSQWPSTFGARIMSEKVHI